MTRFNDQIQSLAKEEVFSLLHSRREGLQPEEVEERQREVGKNSFEIKERFKGLKLLARQFLNFFTILLFVASAICFIADHIQPDEGMGLLGWALAVVSLLNALFSFMQEYRAEKAMEALKKFLPQKVRVIRANAEEEVLATELVPGDILLLEEGDKVPADARLFEANSLSVNNAPLTGESKNIQLTAEPQDSDLLESKNIVFAGCSILKGKGKAIVFATGFRTQFGKIAQLSHTIKRPPSPLDRETYKMIRVLTTIAMVMGMAFFAYGVAIERPLWVNLVFMMGIIVANVPEGLLPTFTMALGLAGLRMAKKNVLVKGMNAIEALGAVHVICTDKTGTLTKNELRIHEVFSLDTAGKLQSAGDSKIKVLQAAAIASEVERKPDGSLRGDPLDVEIFQNLAQFQEQSIPPSEAFFPFDTEKRRSAGIGERDGQCLFAVKGAWEALRPMISVTAQNSAVTEEYLSQVDLAVKNLASEGKRVIAVASRLLNELPLQEKMKEQEMFESNLTLEGFLALDDPLREGIAESVDLCHTAGIDVILITGDHPDTAKSIARQAHILLDGEDATGRVVTGDALSKMIESELMDKIQGGARVFARTTPEQKMKIVSALKAMELVTAMTGDGVNDSIALKAADVGIAMGKSGTDVARESAQIILLDDNFNSIVKGIEEGRTVFENIRKFTNYVLVSNGPEIFPYLLYIAFPVPLALNVLQILSIDLGTDIVPSMALGSEPPDPDVMKKPPRTAKEGLLTAATMVHSYLFLGVIEGIYSLFLFFYVLLKGGWTYGAPIAESAPLYRSASGIALASILLMQIGNLIGRRYRLKSGLDKGIFRNKLMLLGILIQIVFATAIVYWPPIQKVYNSAPVEPHVFFLAWLGIPIVFGLDYIRKIFLRKHER